MAPRFSVRRIAVNEFTFGDDVRAGLTAARKSISPYYFYDDLGSALFEAICHLPEYYLMRAETEALQNAAGTIAAEVGKVARIIELGSGTAHKTRLLLDAIAPPLFLPVDIDAQVLDKAGRELTTEYKKLRVEAVCADFTKPGRALERLAGSGRTLVLFLGSTIGNFDPKAATALLKDIGDILHPGDFFLLGADLKKPKPVLDAAYDDSLGVTAAFNRNLLARINRELGGRFDLQAFAHKAFYDEEQGRIEMHLVSLEKQKVRIDGLKLEVAFKEEETIHTENSYKYGQNDLRRLANESEFEIVKTFYDSRQWFADVLMQIR